MRQFWNETILIVIHIEPSPKCMCYFFFYFCHFWAIFHVFWQNSPSFVFRICYLKKVATNTRCWGWEITIQNYHLGFHKDISFTIKKKTRAQVLVYTQKRGTTCFHQSRHCISLDLKDRLI